jgi:hypothetical protein
MTALGVAFPLAGEQEKGKSKGGPGGRKTGSRAGVVVFGEQDKLILREYARRFGPNLPPGLAQRDDLPPGLEKQLVRKGHLPPGLEKRVVPFPPEIEQRLPPLGAELRRGFIAGRAIIFHSGSRLILDVFVPLD